MGTTQALTLRDEQQLVARNDEISDVQRLGKLMAASNYFADAREMAQAAVKIQAGKELGIPPVASMMGINIIKGKIALGGNLIASRIRAHGYDFVHKQFDASGCVLVFLGRKGEPDRGHGMLAGRPILGESSFNEADYKAAQIQNDGYRKYPRNMYFNRAISNGAKWYTPEVFAGAPVYVPEELGAAVDENGDMVHPEPTKAEQAAARDAVRDRRLAEIRQQQAHVQTAPPQVQDEYFERDHVCVGEPPSLEPPAESQPSRQFLSPHEFRRVNMRARLDAFAELKVAIGDEQYYRILGVCGVEHANQFKTLSEVVSAYTEMLTVWNDMQGGPQ